MELRKANMLGVHLNAATALAGMNMQVEPSLDDLFEEGWAKTSTLEDLHGAMNFVRKNPRPLNLRPASPLAKDCHVICANWNRASRLQAQRDTNGGREV